MFSNVQFEIYPVVCWRYCWNSGWTEPTVVRVINDICIFTYHTLFFAASDIELVRVSFGVTIFEFVNKFWDEKLRKGVLSIYK